MSLTGSVVIMVVIAARMAMGRLPKKYIYALWGIVGFRLLCPVTLESSFSIFNIRPIKNSVDTVKELPLIQYGSGYSGQGAGDVADTAVKAASEATQAGHVNMLPAILTMVWVAVAVGILCYIVYQYVVMRRNLSGASEIRPGVYSGNMIDSPFVMGIIKPRIYMPRGITDDEMEYLVLHEKTHIRRGDVFFKALGIVVLAIHWFNPLVWIAYTMFVRDMEMSCDEEVISKMGAGVKADYSMSLVSFARRNNGSRYIVVPVAFSNRVFGGKEVKMRIKNVLGYNGTSKLLSTVALVLVASVGLICLFNGKSFADETDGEDAQASEVEVAEVADETAADETTADETVVIDDENGGEVEVAVTPSDDTSAPETVDAAGTGAITENSDNILGITVPVVNGVSVDVELNIPKGTTCDDDSELVRFMVVGQPLASDVYSIYYSEAFSKTLTNEYIQALADAGFTGELEEGMCEGYYSASYRGVNSDGVNAVVEVFGSDYSRVAFIAPTDDGSVNAFYNFG